MNKKDFKCGDRVFHIETGRLGTVLSVAIIGCFVEFDDKIGTFYVQKELLELCDDIVVCEKEFMKLFQPRG